MLSSSLREELVEISVNWSAHATAGALWLVSLCNSSTHSLPLFVIASLTFQDISVTLLAYKLRKGVSVLPGAYLLAFVYHFQYNWHEWIERNATILLVTDILLSWWTSLYASRWWWIFWCQKQRHIHLYFRLTWHQWNHSLDCRVWVCLLLATGSVSSYLTKGQMLHCSGTEWGFQSAWGTWVPNENSTCTHSLTHSELSLASTADRDRRT